MSEEEKKEEEVEEEAFVPSIDVVVPISNVVERLPYLKHCLRSIASQDYPEDRYEIIVACIMEEGESRGAIRDLGALCAEFHATVVFKPETDPAFSLARAYNIGVRHGSREAVACLNCDVYFHPKLFSFAAQVLNKGKMAVVPVARSDGEPGIGMFDEDIPKMAQNDEEWGFFADRLDCRRDGMGNAFYPRSFFEKAHGFDERLYGWGAEDYDLATRAERAIGLVHLLDLGCPKGIHIMHPASPSRESEMTERNRKIVFSSQSLVRNPESWGGVPVPDDDF